MVMRVRAKALGFGGECVCESLDDAQSKLVFVPGLIPGESAEVSPVKEERNLVFAELKVVEDPSPERQIPPCPYFGACGGCNLQQISIEGQRKHKFQMVVSMLEKQGGIKPHDGAHSLSDGLPAFNYRKRVTLHLDKDGRLGFYRAGTEEVVPITSCLIAAEGINTILTGLIPHVGGISSIIDAIEVDVSAEKAAQIVFKTHDNAYLQALEKKLPLFAPFQDLGEIHYQIRGRDYFVSNGELVQNRTTPAGHFSQVNPVANRRLVDTVLSRIKNTTVTELYAGSGNFTFPLYENGCAVTAVELNPVLVAVGTKKAQTAKAGSKISFVKMRCEDFVLAHDLAPTVVLDPPRAGIKELIKHGRWKGVREIHYVSCNLPSLTRDLKMFAEKGFIVKSVEFVDMFPQTHHVELIAWLVRPDVYVK